MDVVTSYNGKAEAIKEDNPKKENKSFLD